MNKKIVTIWALTVALAFYIGFSINNRKSTVISSELQNAKQNSFEKNKPKKESISEEEKPTKRLVANQSRNVRITLDDITLLINSSSNYCF